ncbi:MAG: hypothetical protein ABSG07_17265 [Terriglobales bacterium]|jgi:hypothetical protein
MRRVVIPIIFLILATLCAATEKVSFDDVKIHRHKSPDNRMLVDKTGVLTFDDGGRKLSFSDHAGDTFEVRYDDISKVVFEVTTHMHGPTISTVALTAVGGGALGGIAKALHVQDHWFYLEYKNGDHDERILLEVPKESSEQVISRAQSLFGSRVTMPEFQEKGEAIEKGEDLDEKHIPDLRSQHTVTVDKKNHALPKVMADKATIVVVCPSLAARYAGHSNQFKLHANDRVIAVNKFGTYSFAYLDPGHYHLISQSENANGFEIDLEAGKSYYFMQNTFEGIVKGRTMLSRNSPELVMYEVDGSYFSDWKRKSKPNEVVPESIAHATQ